MRKRVVIGMKQQPPPPPPEPTRDPDAYPCHRPQGLPPTLKATIGDRIKVKR